MRSDGLVGSTASLIDMRSSGLVGVREANKIETATTSLIDYEIRANRTGTATASLIDMRSDGLVGYPEANKIEASKTLALV